MEKEIDNGKARERMGGLLVFCLFVFFVWVMHSFCVSLRIAEIFPFPVFSNFFYFAPTRYKSVTAIMTIVICCYSLLSVAFFMKRDKSSVFCLRLSVVFVFLLQVLWFATYYEPMPAVETRLVKIIFKTVGHLIWLSFPFFIFVFFYFKHSRASKMWIAHGGRKVGWLGWLGLALIVICLTMEAVMFMRQYSFYKEASIKDKVLIEKGEMTDGRFAFVPMDGWCRVDDACLSESTRAFHFLDSLENSIVLYSGATDMFTRSFFNAEVGNCLVKCDANSRVKEVACIDTVLADRGSVFLSVYEKYSDSISDFYTCSAFHPVKSHKYMIMSVAHSGKPGDGEWIVRFWNSVRCDLKQTVPKE